jgi:hypothetical protein
MLASFLKSIFSGIYNLLATILFWILFILGFIFVLYYTFKILFGTTWDAFVKKFEKLKTHAKNKFKVEEKKVEEKKVEKKTRFPFVPDITHQTGLNCKLNANDLLNNKIYKNGKLVKDDVSFDCGNCRLYEYKSPEGCINYNYLTTNNMNEWNSDLICQGTSQECKCEIDPFMKPSPCGF